MEVVAATPNGNGVSPFHNHDVREWSRIDSLTGILERARLETDHWTASTSNASHKYGKVVDSRARSGADGSVQQQARRQLEVFQSQIPGGRLQVIKTQTVSSSRWTNKTSSTLEAKDSGTKDFENLQLQLNPLDLSSEKAKASVGRSVVRRPPTRPRIREDPATNGTEPKFSTSNLQSTAATNLHRVSRLCHQIHENAVRETFGNYFRRSPQQPRAEQRQNGDGSESGPRNDVENELSKPINGHHTNLARTKSTSSEDLCLTNPDKDKTKSIEDLEDLEQLQNWRRTSRIRRSLQFPKQSNNKNQPNRPPDLPISTGSVRKIKEDLETGRRLNTALRGNNVDLEALDQILQSISSSSSIYSDQSELPDKESSNLTAKQKRNSFVTVETLKEVKGRLRRTSFPSADMYKTKKDEEPDDGIVTEDQTANEFPNTSPSRVKSYIYGMETLNGTGSLESRSKHLNSNVSNRNEDWYNRRKSYGFEQVQNHQEPTISSKTKSKIESSTDSGICRSSEIVLVPTKLRDFDEDSYFSSNNRPKIDTVIHPGSVKKFSTLFEQSSSKNESNKSSLNWKTNSDLESTTIRIPIGQNSYGNHHQRPVSDGTKFSNATTWIKPEENKRHSIAVDEYKYVNNKNAENKYRRTSLAMNDSYYPEDGEENTNGKKTKKVEFCKTEVHFAADSGRVNIVETDEKPPPTQNFRRRRRNSGLSLSQLNDIFPSSSSPTTTATTTTTTTDNTLPILHFGDTSYEKNLYVSAPNTADDTIYENVINPKKELVSCNTVTINTHTNNNVQQNHVQDSENDFIKGILKNKPIKPKPYILGESQEENGDNGLWGVKLKPVQKEDKPIWRSTVTVRNTFFDTSSNHMEDQQQPQQQQQQNPQPEFQKLLKSLRPTSKQAEETLFDKRTADAYSGINIVAPPLDTRRSSWSVADRVKQVEDLQWTENKGYSTKVTIGEGDSIVVENLTEKERHPTWPRKEETFKDVKKQVLKKGLVVRIGRDDSKSKHTVCSKTTTNRDNSNTTTTTTKITIDLTPSPTNHHEDNLFQNVRLADSSSAHSFKSTSLILNTIKTESECGKTSEKIPQQLEALRRLYEDVHSDSEADKEVQKLMSNDEDVAGPTPDTGSVLSGSWSKMRSFKTLNQYIHKTSLSNHAVHAHIEKGITNSRIDNYEERSSTSQDEKPAKNIVRSKSSPIREKYSPSLIRKSGRTVNKNETFEEKLSSSSLVGQKVYEKPEELRQQHAKSPKSEVLRVPKKSEMAYFGVRVSPKPDVKSIKPKTPVQTPDLLQFNRTNSLPKKSKTAARLDKTPKGPEPTYENVDMLKKNMDDRKKEFDSSILEELTKAADQIMQAVNEYAEEDRARSDEDKKRLKEPLDTISETKSWKRECSVSQRKPSNTYSRSKLKSTSSNSSIESFTRECSKATSTPVKKIDKSSYERQQQQQRKKSSTSSDTNNVKALTRARRLQRASSREALLQSHGSSSEDLPTNIEMPIRKPRLVRRTKTTQLTMSNGLEMHKKTEKPSGNKKPEESLLKKDDRHQGLREIRHKTAVSTIRSTAEKAASRERSKLKTEELKKKATSKNTSKGTSVTSKGDRNRSLTPKETISQRVPSAVAKKPIPFKVSARS